MSVATLSTKGQVTIPKVIRESLRLHAGDKIEFVFSSQGEAILRPITRRAEDVFGKLFVEGRKPISTEEMDRAIQEKIRATFK